MSNLFGIIVLISAITLIISVAMQEGADQSSVLTGQGPGSLFGANRAVGREYTLKRITMISAIVFMLSNIVLITL